MESRRLLPGSRLIPEDTSQTLPGRLSMDFLDLILGTSQFSGKNIRVLAAISVNICLEYSRADLGLEAVRFVSPTHFARRNQRQRREI